MKRYFLVPPTSRPGCSGNYHYIDLGSHGPAGAGHHVAVLLDDHVEAPEAWIPFPHIIDARTTMADHGHHGRFADVGVKPHHTAIEAAAALAKIHPMFRP